MTNLFDTINNSNFDFYFLVVDDFLDIKLPQLSNFYSLSPQILGITLVQNNSGRLLAHPKTLEFIRNNSAKSGRRPAIVPFKPSAKIELICKNNNWLLVANPSSLNRLLENKLKFSLLCKKYHLPQIPSLILPFTKENFSKSQKILGQKLVLQSHFGWAGNSSLLTSSYSKALKKFTPGTPIKFSSYKSGYSLINNCCLTNRGLIQSPPGLQFTGISPLTQNQLATVGRQWPCQAPAHIQEKVKQITSDFSDILNDLKYLGFFGLDFFVSNNHVFLLECNPRLTASFAFYTDMEIRAKITPLFLYHLAQFCNLKFQDLELPRFFNSKIIGSEITSKNSSGATLKKYHDFSTFSPSSNPVSISSQILSKVL